jgi:FKBP-type peptidyl-prolyl cis-trans isomerase SlyD
MTKTETSKMRVVRDAYVVLDYALHDEDGDIIEATDEEGGRPIGFVYGYGSLVPGLEAALVGMAEGETREVVVSPEEGYGAYDEEKEFWVDRGDFPDDVKLDDELSATDEHGDEVSLRVIEIGDDAVLVDANHPLAGETLYFDVIVRAVRAATSAELGEAKRLAPKRSIRVMSDAAAVALHGAAGVTPEGAPGSLALEPPKVVADESRTAKTIADRGERAVPGLTDDEQ